MSDSINAVVGRLKEYHDEIAVGDIIHWNEWWGRFDQWAEVIAVDQGMTTVHFRVRFEDEEMERWNQEDAEWLRLKHIRGEDLYSPNKGVERLPTREGGSK